MTKRGHSCPDCNLQKSAKCNLCDMVLPVDDCWDSRKSQHEIWHTNRSINKIHVNQTVGIVIWKYV